MKRIVPRIILVAFAACLLGAVVGAVAQSVSATANGSWVAPVNDANGFPLAGSPNAVTSYNVYASTTPLSAVPSTAPIAVVTAPATSVSGTVTVNVGDTLYLYVTACNGAGCSGLSNPGTKLVTAPGAPPGVPTSVSFSIAISLPAH